MLLVVALGLSVVTESLGKTMNKCVALAAAHFIFGGNRLLPDLCPHGSYLLIL